MTNKCNTWVYTIQYQGRERNALKTIWGQLAKLNMHGILAETITYILYLLELVTVL